MAPIKVTVNTLFQEDQSPFVDPLSKYYIIVECIFGLNRLPVILKRNRYFNLITFLTCACSIVFISGIIYGTYQPLLFNLIIWFTLFFEYGFCTVFSLISWKRVYLFYREMSEFDIEIGCRPKTTSESMWHLIIMTVFVILVSIIHALLDIVIWSVIKSWTILFWVMDMIHCFEVSYHGHLLSLLVARLRIMNYYMKVPLSNGTMTSRPNIEELVSFKRKNNENSQMMKMMDLYHVIIKSFDLLMNAVKWQLLVILISAFIRTLNYCYESAMRLTHNTDPPMGVYTGLVMVTAQLLPLMSPCVFSDRVYNEVRKMRELIASRLYENKLDKAGRLSARALLALTEARDLSFSLLRMLRVDVALPFKFTGLLVTYLIILVQFDKVIHPATPTAST